MNILRRSLRVLWIPAAILLGIAAVVYLARDTGPNFDSAPANAVVVNPAQTTKDAIDAAVAATVTALSESARAPSPTIVSPQSAVQPARTRPPAWRRVAGWQGSSIKDTETFSITSDEWRIRWETSEGKFGALLFQIFVYTSSGDVKSIAANVSGRGSDVSYVRGSGRYYLTINSAAQPYSVVVEQRK